MGHKSILLDFGNKLGNTDRLIAESNPKLQTEHSKCLLTRPENIKEVLDSVEQVQDVVLYGY